MSSLSKIKEDVRNRSDIADVIGSYIHLKRAGGNFKALCPFHKEKTPSFHVDPRRQGFRCFGCGLGGDVFQFIMEIESVDFITALKILAQKSGIDMESINYDKQKGADKSTLYAIHEKLTSDYNIMLLKAPEAQEARTYLEERNIDQEAMLKFKLGFASNKKDALSHWAKKNGFALENMELAGLIMPSEKKKGLYADRFRNRLMIPISDELNRIVGFSARVLPSNSSPAKYVNSPETYIFKKSKILFGLNWARHSIAEARMGLLCEGQIDVLRCHMHGLTNAVASQGTAVTPEHARILKRYADEVILLFDSDDAGKNAVIKSAPIFVEAGLSIRVAELPEGLDADTFLQEQGAQEIKKRLADALHIIQFQYQTLRKKEKTWNEPAKLRVAQQILHTVRHAQSSIQRDELLSRASDCLNITKKTLLEDLNRVRLPKHRKPEEEESPELEIQNITLPAEEKTLLELLSQHPECKDLVKKFLAPTSLSTPLAQVLYTKLLALIDKNEQEHSSSNFFDMLGEDPALHRLAAEIQITNKTLEFSEKEPESALQELILGIRRKNLERKRARLLEELQRKDPAEQEAIERSCQQLTLAINKLREAAHHQNWEMAEPLLECYTDE